MGPTGPTGATGPDADSLLAEASVNGDGSVNSSTGFSSIVRDAGGQYSLTLSPVPPPDPEIVPVVTIHSVLGTGIPITTVAGGVISVRTVAPADFGTGATSDLAFYIAVGRAVAGPVEDCPPPIEGDSSVDFSIGEG